MQRGQVNLPASVHHSPPGQAPLVCPPTQEDLWHLPGRLSEHFFFKYCFNI